MKLIYIAGPFTADTDEEIHANIDRAESVAAAVHALGHAAICPHSLGRAFIGSQTPEYWYDATLEMMRRCDAVLLVQGWESSSGAVAERLEAHRIGMHVFTSIDGLRLLLGACGRIE